MNLSTEIINYSTKMSLGAGLIAIYNVFVEHKKIFDKDVLYDSAYFGLAILAGNVAKDIIDKNDKLKNLNFLGKFAEPLITAVVYFNLYNIFIQTQFQYISNRYTKTNIVLAGILSLITSYLNNPLSSFFSGVKLI